MASAGAVMLFVLELLRKLLLVTHPLGEYVVGVIHRFLMGETKTLPSINNEILLMPATQLAKKIRKRELSCEKVMQAYVMRSRLVNPYINAVTDERYIDALKDAVAVDEFLASGDKSEDQIEKDTPLLGVPFSCKESLGIKGLRQTNGIVKAKEHLAECDCDAAAMYKKAGAIPVTVTNVPQLCMWWDSTNRIYGMTKNPFDNTRVCGGSTGGEGALITSGGSVMGVGTDIGGSIRIPSAFCGIFGHKPSRGVVSNWGTYPYCYMTPDRKDTRKTQCFISTGPLCRYASDLPLLMKVLSGDDKRIRMDEKVDFRNVKVYYMTGIPGFMTGPRPAVRNAVLKAAKHFEDKFGIKAKELNIEELEHAFAIWPIKFQEVGSPPFRVALLGPPGSKLKLWWEVFKSLFGKSDHTTSALFFAVVLGNANEDVYNYLLKKYKDLHQKFEDIFQENAIFLFPTHPETAPYYHTTIIKTRNIAYTAIFNILGYPSTSIPVGADSKGLPIGVQAISGQFKDHLTIAAAVELEKAFDGWVKPCEINV